MKELTEILELVGKIAVATQAGAATVKQLADEFGKELPDDSEEVRKLRAKLRDAVPRMEQVLANADAGVKESGLLKD